MAGIDVFSLGLIKQISLTGYKSLASMLVPTAIYALQPWIFLSAMSSETMTVMNLTWDLTSDILVTLMGLLFFKEKLGAVRMCGALLAMVSMALLAYKGDDD